MLAIANTKHVKMFPDKFLGRFTTFGGYKLNGFAFTQVKLRAGLKFTGLYGVK